MNIRIGLPAILLATVAGCGSEPGDAPPGTAAAPPRGQAILAPFKARMQQALKDGLAEGAVPAIAACRVEAPAIAGELSVDGVRVGRASHRLRNPANAAPDWVAPVIDEWLAGDADRAPRALALRGGREGYVEPIVAQPMCLTCHGEELAPELAAHIGELYPDDAATGFMAGDLRGVFWAEYPAGAD